jgi:FHS family Na+ dependent glucose MFS transporter 1
MPLWGEKSGPCMQILHFSWAFGAFIAPLIAKHFIQEQQDTDIPNTNFTCLDLPTQLTSPVTNSECFLSFNETCKNLTSISSIDHEVELNFADFNCSMNFDTEPSSQFIYAYFITASLYLPSLAAFMYYAVRHECLRKCCFKETILAQSATESSSNSDPSKAADEASDSMSNKYSLVYVIVLFTLIFCFMFLYVGLEAGFGSLIFTVAVTGRLGFTKSTAAVLQSVFWGTFSFTRLVSVTLALLKVRASIMIMGNLFGSFVASLIMTFYVHNALAIWIGSAVLGMSYASIFPTVMTWMSENAKATGKTTAVLVTGGTLGDITLPATLAALVAKVNPDALIYVTFGGVIVSAGIAGCMFLTACVQKRRQQDGRAHYKRLNRVPLEEFGETSENNYSISDDTDHIGDLNSEIHVNNVSIVKDRESQSTTAL